MQDTLKLMEEDKFKIWVGGDRPADAIIGHLEKGSATIKGQSGKAQSFGGMCVFPNFFQAWGKRVINGQVPVKYTDGTERSVVNVNDNDYKGEVSWLPTGHKDGYIISCRYAKGQNTLDYNYQVSRLGLSKITEDKNGAEDATFYITLPFGENSVFPKNDKTWAEMLLIHPMNIDSGSRMPDTEGDMYKIVRHYDIKKEAVKALDKEWEAYTVVKEASKDFKELLVLKEIMGRKTEIIYDKKDDNTLFESLAYYAKEKSDDFLESVQLFKRSASETIEIGKAFSIFDTTKDGLIAIKIKGKMESLISVKGKGDAMLDVFYSLIMTHEGFVAIKKLELEVSKLK